MGRELKKTAELNLDIAYGIRKICNGNLKYFYEAFIDKNISIHDFYDALKYRNSITKEVDQELEEAYALALNQFGLTHDQLVVVPSLEKFLLELQAGLDMLPVAPSKISFEVDKFLPAIKLYNRLIELSLLKFEKPKKSQLL